MSRPRQMLPIVLAFFASFTAMAPAFACIWSYGTNLRGKKVQVSGVGGVDDVVSALSPDSYIDWHKERRVYAQEAARTSDYRVRNDYAVTLLHVGEVREATRILRKLEDEKPGMYETAANLGTALELGGKNSEALRWIRESIRRDARAHDGTEWLHVRILQAKIALERDREWLVRNSVLGLDFGAHVMPQMPRVWPADNLGRRATPEIVQKALFYQLDERIEFVRSPDPAVASLLFDWANLAMLTNTLETAEELYVQALRFNPQNAPLVRARLAHVQQLLKKYNRRQR